MHSRSFIRVSILAWLAVAAPGRADTATAEALFREGKQLMAEGKYELACQKLADSYRADPATGALLATALCYEKAGKTASAWAAYTEVATRARSERHQEREQAARARVSALEPKLSRLTVEVDPETAGLAGFSVLRDGETWARGAWNTAVPVDPGAYRIEVRAEGHRTWSTTVRVGPDGDRASVRVPKLEAVTETAPSEAGAGTPAADAPAPVDAGVSSSSPLRTWAFVAGGAGVVGIGIGSYFGLRAISKNDESQADCDGNVCGPSGTDARNSARTSGTISTIAFAAGGVLLATGVTLFVIGGQQTSSARTVTLSGQVAPGHAAAVLGGTF